MRFSKHMVQFSSYSSVLQFKFQENIHIIAFNYSGKLLRSIDGLTNSDWWPLLSGVIQVDVACYDINDADMKKLFPIL